MIKTIRAKIVWAFALLVLLNLAAGFWSIYNFYALGTTIDSVLHENYRSVLAAENLVKWLERQDNALLVAGEGEDETVTGRFDQNRELFSYWYDQAVGSQSLQSRETLRDSLRSAYRYYSLVADSMSARIKQGAFQEAAQYYYTSVRPASDELRGLGFRLFEINQGAMDNAMPRMQSISTQAAYGTMMTSIISLILSIIATAWLTRVLITPAEKLTERVKEIGAGKLDLKIDVLSADEIGQLSREFNKMTERLKRFEQMNIDQILAEKRKSEAIVESISDGLIVTDASSIIMHLNRVIADLFGIDEQAAIGKPVSSVIRDERIISLIRPSAEHLHEGADHRVNYLLFSRGDKQYFYRPKVTTIYDSEGSVYGMLTLLQDVTQFKELDRMKSDFIATLSHEFRTPLTSINMSVDILNQGILGPLNERQRELINSTREDCFRLTKLARELLQLSKLESGKLELRNEQINLFSVIEFSLKSLQLQFNEKNVRLVTDVPAELPQLIADEQQISWVITNLVTNALKYTDAGGTVTVRARDQGDSILVDVIDTGHGIARENLDRIFDKFVQVKRASDSTPGSVGLGLAIAKEIVELYGGRIWAESEPGRGSTFSFLLPLKQPHHFVTNG
jgi:NtrC-family two-component system sensor histidine kinase KinB